MSDLMLFVGILCLGMGDDCGMVDTVIGCYGRLADGMMCVWL